MSSPFVTSKFTREPNDHYATVDPRCMIALRASWDLPLPAIDVCHGSDPTPLHPARNGHMRDILGPPRIGSVITNPPYKRGLVDSIMSTLIDCVRTNDLDLVAALLRVQWDCASTRAHMFEPPFAGTVKLQFRPWWFEKRSSPIHNYQWLIWDRRHTGEPIIRYHNGKEK